MPGRSAKEQAVNENRPAEEGRGKERVLHPRRQKEISTVAQLQPFRYNLAWDPDENQCTNIKSQDKQQDPARPGISLWVWG